MKNKVVVTGATGLVGSHLLIKLVEEYKEVVALYRNKESIRLIGQLFDYYGKSALFDKVNWQKVDVLDFEVLCSALKNADVVYHTAALVSFEKKDSEKLFKTNVEGTQNILAAIEKNKITNLIFISSVASIRNKDNNGFFVSNGTVDGQREWSDYARSKAQSEELVLKAKKTGLKTVIINPGVILGPGDKRKSSTVIFNTIQQGLSFYTLGVNGFVDVRDVVDAVLLLTNLSQTSDRYVCVGSNTSFKNVFEIISKALSVKAPKYKANKLLLSIAWRLEFVMAKINNRTPKLTQDNTSSALEIIRYDSSLLKSELNFKFRTLEDASKNAADFFRFIKGTN